MGEPAVELVFLVIRVPVDHLAVDDDAYLMPGARQTVGALDVAQVPVFQDRVDAMARGRENIIELRAPPHFLAHRQGGAELFLGGEPLAAGLGYPAAGVVERSGQLGQIQHGFLDAGPGRLGGSLRTGSR